MNQPSLQNSRVTLYQPNLRALAITPIATILWSQLDFWFSSHAKGFYKFLCPPKTHHHLYRHGDSWTEELYFSAKEFRHAFDLIGVRHTSKGAFDRAENPFIKDGKERYFCCYHDKIKGTTHYFRNHQFTDEALTNLANQSATTTPKKPQKSQLPKGQLRSDSPVSSTLYTEMIPENTNTAAELSPNLPPKTESDVTETLDLSAFTDPEKPKAKKILSPLNLNKQQQVLLVLITMINTSTVRNKLGYLTHLVNSTLTGSFTEIEPKAVIAPPVYHQAKPPAKELPPVDNAEHFANIKQKYGDDAPIPENPEESHRPDSLPWQDMKRNVGIFKSAKPE